VKWVAPEEFELAVFEILNFYSCLSQIIIMVTVLSALVSVCSSNVRNLNTPRLLIFRNFLNLCLIAELFLVRSKALDAMSLHYEEPVVKPTVRRGLEGGNVFAYGLPNHHPQVEHTEVYLNLPQSLQANDRTGWCFTTSFYFEEYF